MGQSDSATLIHCWYINTLIHCWYIYTHILKFYFNHAEGDFSHSSQREQQERNPRLFFSLLMFNCLSCCHCWIWEGFETVVEERWERGRCWTSITHQISILQSFPEHEGPRTSKSRFAWCFRWAFDATLVAITFTKAPSLTLERKMLLVRYNNSFNYNYCSYYLTC